MFELAQSSFSACLLVGWFFLLPSVKSIDACRLHETVAMV